MTGDYFYSKCHISIRKNNGKATKCENEFCETINPKRFDWALKKGHSYSENVEDYIQLCRSCHIKYDFTQHRRDLLSKRLKERTNPNINIGRYGSTHTSAKPIVKKDKITKHPLKYYGSVSEVINDGYRPDTISMCLTRKNKTSNGFIWEYIN